MKLKKIANLRSGLVLNRVKDFEKIKFKYKLLTLSSLSNEGLINRAYLEDFYSIKELEKEFFTQEGDIVVRLREPIIASYITKNEENILIPSYFGIIRVSNKEFIPQYIASLINQEKLQKELYKDISGTAVTIIKIQSLSEINIKKMDIEKQKKIGRITELYIKEMELMRQLLDKKQKLYKGLFQKMI